MSTINCSRRCSSDDVQFVLSQLINIVPNKFDHNFEVLARCCLQLNHKICKWQGRGIAEPSEIVHLALTKEGTCFLHYFLQLIPIEHHNHVVDRCVQSLRYIRTCHIHIFVDRQLATHLEQTDMDHIHIERRMALQ